MADAAQRTRQARYREANRDRLRESQGAWREANRERNRAAQAAYREANLEKMRARSAAWAAANRERARATTAAWIKANPERAKASRGVGRVRRRLRMRGNEWESFKNAEVFDRDAWTCQLCGDPIDRSARAPDPVSVSIDHIIPVSRGGPHTRANVQAAHRICNQRKGAKG